ncbi:MAG TPA: YceI family protein [Mariprofundaceae bacterium]|nr:YceI family protein [Mariprofundaceae bacterium]
MKKVWMLLLLLAPMTAWAGDLMLDNGSSAVSFVSVKKGSVGEVHHFTRLSGEAGAHEASVMIDLASVESGIDIRNERMRSLLFNVAKFASATIRADISSMDVQNLKAGEQKSGSLMVEVALHGVVKQLPASVSVVRLKDGGLLVNSRAPVIVKAADFGLDSGIEALRHVAKLPSIATAVPVTFELHFIH